MIRMIKRLARNYFPSSTDRILNEELMELIPDAALALSPKGIIVGLNKAFAKTTGRQYDHILNSSVLEHLNDLDSIETVYACLKQPIAVPPLLIQWSGVWIKCIRTEARVQRLGKRHEGSNLVLFMLKEQLEHKTPLLLQSN